MKKELKGRILIVDDESINILMLKNVLKADYAVYASTDGADAIETAKSLIPDIILLDVVMPDIDGYEVIKVLKNTRETKAIPVIFLTSKNSPEDEVKGLKSGAVDYINKPFSPEMLLQRVGLHVHLRRYEAGLEDMVEQQTKKVMELKGAILETVAELVESRDSVTGGHIERTQNYLRMLVNHLLDDDIYPNELLNCDIDLMAMSSQLHDVGKISVRDTILMKPGKLTDEEFEIMKGHVLAGKEIVEKIESKTEESSFLSYAKIFTTFHHERWDGGGYPFGLKEEETPFYGRIMAIIDVYDALTNIRPYKRAFSHEEALEIIAEGKGTQFDPLICECFLKHEKDFEDLYKDQKQDITPD